MSEPSLQPCSYLLRCGCLGTASCHGHTSDTLILDKTWSTRKNCVGWRAKDLELRWKLVSQLRLIQYSQFPTRASCWYTPVPQWLSVLSPYFPSCTVPTVSYCSFCVTAFRSDGFMAGLGGEEAHQRAKKWGKSCTLHLRIKYTKQKWHHNSCNSAGLVYFRLEFSLHRLWCH